MVACFRIRRYAATVCSFIFLTSCATGQLPPISSTGTVRMYDGRDWPADRLIWNHPSIAVAQPISKKFWDAGNRYEFHCWVMDEAGEANRITFWGVMFYSTPSNEPHGDIFGGNIDRSQLRAAGGNTDRVQRLIEDTYWKLGGGDPIKMNALIKSAVEHDAECYHRDLKMLQLYGELSLSNLALLRDWEGRPVVASVTRDPDRDRKALELLRENSITIQNTIQIYRWIAQSLSKRAAEQAQVSAVLPTPPTETSRQTPSLPKNRRSEKLVTPTSVAVDTTPLEKVNQELVVEAAKLKYRCLLTADPKCPA